MRYAPLVLLAACGGSSGPSGPAVDPDVLAGQVQQTELEASIKALEMMGTRYTLSDGDERARDYLVGRFATIGLTAELDPFQVQNQMANNIIAKHPGTDSSSNEVYIFSAHYDSTSNTPMTAAPGADDNATGVAAVLEAARIITPHAFKHDIWFVLTAAEEQGSLGSKHMVGWLKSQGINVKGVIAPDMIGYWPAGDQDQFDILGDPASSFLVDHMATVATRQGIAHKKYIEHTFCYGDDHTNFQEAGFPAITPMDCVEAHNVAGSLEDTPHYHRPTDTFATLHMGFTTKVVGVIVTTLAELGAPVAK
ncbi:MAG: M20/M25/M40 family metallo-hydrolase [Myxococcota bacterium]|nr:M20/M25/M40 family metallo-hydrolase [Deltaproteobacteria bacterium]MDQ3341102.1 M20/M25/M40 family metallo-hydrolase [Myxococcota bacterium]